MPGEDFGYLKDEEQDRFSHIIKKSLVVGTILFSISCFFYITVSAYDFVYNQGNTDVILIKSPDFPIKVYEEDQDKNHQTFKNTDKSVYENIVGNKKEKLENTNIKTIKNPNPNEIVNINKNVKNSLSEKQIQESAKAITSGNSRDSGIIVYDNSSSNQKVVNQVNQKTQQLSNNNSKKILDKSGSVKSGLARVQLAALKNQNMIEDYWKKLNNKHKNLLSGLNHFVEEADLGSKGKFYRLQVGNFRNQNEAEGFCKKFISELNKNKSDCIVVE